MMLALLLAVTLHGTVTRVIDGDTVVVSTAGTAHTIRLVGVDTPETHHPTKPVERCGPEAEAFTREALEGKRVRLDLYGRDFYGRTLGYVWRGRWLFNRRLIQHGWATAYPAKHLLRSEFRALEGTARLRGVGRWNPKGCGS